MEQLLVFGLVKLPGCFGTCPFITLDADLFVYGRLDGTAFTTLLNIFGVDVDSPYDYPFPVSPLALPMVYYPRTLYPHPVLPVLLIIITVVLAGTVLPDSCHLTFGLPACTFELFHCPVEYSEPSAQTGVVCLLLPARQLLNLWKRYRHSWNRLN